MTDKYCVVQGNEFTTVLLLLQAKICRFLPRYAKWLYNTNVLYTAWLSQKLGEYRDDKNFIRLPWEGTNLMDRTLYSCGLTNFEW